MIGRPQETEAAPYYFTYINQVKGEDPVAAMESQLDDSLRFFSGISEQKSLHRYAPEKWSIRQTLSHVSDAERVFAYRAMWFARGSFPCAAKCRRSSLGAARALMAAATK